MAIFHLLTGERAIIYGDILLNRVPQTSWRDMAERTINQQINPWIRPGANTMNVRLTWPKDRPFVANESRLVLRVVAMALTDNDLSTPLIEMKWPPLKDEAYPGELRCEFTPAEPPPVSLWNDAATIKMEPKTHEAIIQQVQELHAALNKRDIAAVEQMLEYKTSDLAKAMYLEPQNAKKSHREFFEQFFNQDRWAMAPIEREQLRLKIVGEERIIIVIDAIGREVLVSADHIQPQLRLPLFFAQIKNEFMVVR